MKIDKEKFIKSAEKIGLTERQMTALWHELEKKLSYAKFEASHLLYYFGAMVVIIAMAWFVGSGWENLGGLGVFAIAALYITSFSILGVIFWNKDSLKVPGGLFMTMAVCLIPLFLINVSMVFLSVLLQRTVFLIFGAIGIFGYLSMQFYQRFSDSFWFPIVLSLFGIAIIFLGIYYQRNRQNIEAKILSCVPESLRHWLPR